MEKLLTSKEAMDHLGIKSYITLKSYIKKGLGVYQMGERNKFSKKDLDSFAEAHHVFKMQEPTK